MIIQRINFFHKKLMKQSILVDLAEIHDYIQS